MKRFSEQLQKKAAAISLTASEAAILRERLAAYMEYHPLPVAATAAPRKKIFNDSFIEVSMPARYTRSLVAFSVVALLVIVPTLAEQAIPGDVLYPIKVQVNEEVRSTFASDGYEKIAWETKRLERRISEARLLAKEGKLTSDIEAGVIAAVQLHAKATEAEINTLRTSDGEAAALASLTLASVLDIQSAALKANDTGSTTRGMSTVLLASALDIAQANVVADNNTTVSPERLIAQLEQETTRGRELLASIQPAATPSEINDLNRRLSDIERKVGSSVELSANNPVEAVEILLTTWRDMQVLITFMTDIDVRTNLALESLVPAVLTPDEEVIATRIAYDKAARQLDRLKVQVPNMEPSGLKDKFLLALPEVESLLQAATSSLATDSTNARKAAIAAYDYTRSMVESLRENNEVGQPVVTTATSTATTTLSTATSTETTSTTTTR
mgnify:CR=1 FL=1